MIFMLSLTPWILSQGKKPTKRKAASATASDVETVDLQWPPQEEDFVNILEEQGWGLDQFSITTQTKTAFMCNH